MEVQKEWNKLESTKDYFDNVEYLASFLQVGDLEDQVGQVVSRANREISQV